MHPRQLPALKRQLKAQDWEGRLGRPQGCLGDTSSTGVVLGAVLGRPHKSWKETNLRMVTPLWRWEGGGTPAGFVESQVKVVLFAFNVF